MYKEKLYDVTFTKQGLIEDVVLYNELCYGSNEVECAVNHFVKKLEQSNVSIKRERVDGYTERFCYNETVYLATVRELSEFEQLKAEKMALVDALYYATCNYDINLSIYASDIVGKNNLKLVEQCLSQFVWYNTGRAGQLHNIRKQ